MQVRMDGGFTAGILLSPLLYLRTTDFLSKRWGPPHYERRFPSSSRITIGSARTRAWVTDSSVPNRVIWAVPACSRGSSVWAGC